MKTKKEVMAFLKSNFIGEKSANKILGFLLGKGVLEKGEVVCFKRVEDCSNTMSFDDFYEWYNNNGEKKGLKNGYSDERFNKFYDSIMSSQTLEQRWYILCKLAEIANHLNKTNTQKEDQKSKFKVGDYVKVVKKTEFPGDGEMDYLFGRIIKIVSFSKIAGYRVKPDITSGESWFFNEQSLELSTKEEYDKQCKQDAINALKKDYTEWRKHNDVQLAFKNELDLCSKITSYTELCLFAQWINGIYIKEPIACFICVDEGKLKIIDKVYQGCVSQVIFNTNAAAQLAIDVLGEDLIKKALM